MWIVLSDVEQHIAKYIAEERHKRNISRGFKEKKISNRDTTEMELNAVGAELAHCKVHNVYPDLQADIPNVEDCYTKWGWSKDVKCVDNPNGDLFVVPWKINKRCKFYVHVIGKMPRYKIVGMIEHGDLFVPERLADPYNYGQKAYRVKQSELILDSDGDSPYDIFSKPIEELI